MSQNVSFITVSFVTGRKFSFSHQIFKNKFFQEPLEDNWSTWVALSMLHINFYWENARNKKIFNFSCFQKSRGCIFVSFVTRFVLSTTVVKQKMSKNFICHLKGVPATISHKVTQIWLKIRCIYCLLFKPKKALWM
jgi:hypothetical protein